MGLFLHFDIWGPVEVMMQEYDDDADEMCLLISRSYSYLVSLCCKDGKSGFVWMKECFFG